MIPTGGENHYFGHIKNKEKERIFTVIEALKEARQQGRPICNEVAQ